MASKKMKREEEEELFRKYAAATREDSQASIGQQVFYIFCAVLVTASPVCTGPAAICGSD